MLAQGCQRQRKAVNISAEKFAKCALYASTKGYLAVAALLYCTRTLNRSTVKYDQTDESDQQTEEEACKKFILGSMQKVHFRRS